MGAITRGIANNVLGTGEIDATDGVNGVIPASNVNNTSFGSVTSLPALAGTITTVAGDPPAPSEGQVWYNSVAGALKVYGYSRAWATGGNLNTARQSLAGAGSQTAALAAGGYNGTADVAVTETYDGTSWTEVNDLNTSRRYLEGAGTTAAAVVFGGYIDSTATEEWDGTNWTTAPGTLNTGSHGIAGTGTQTAAIGAGRAPTGTNSELYDGTSWTVGNPLNTARAYAALSGVQTSSLFSGGQDAVAGTTATEAYDGTSWTTVADMNSGRVGLGSGGSDNTSAVAFGGPGPSNATEEYDGTQWITSSTMTTGRQYLAGVGTSTSALAIGGRLPAASNATEEFTLAAANLTISES
jgi:hypothetical protein